ncbi:MAG: hypothetical protein QOI02_1405 [Actinomycetota bacterium]|nr:hypothetical protein [Actinomycetota bacterium]
MTDAGHNPDDYCYRHPDRLSFVLCERCGRTICLECQRHVDGRVLCPDDATEARPVIPTRAKRFANRNRRRVRTLAARVPTDKPVVTYTIIGVIVVLWVVDLFWNGAIQKSLWYIPNTESVRPWTVVTSMFANSGGTTGLLSVLSNAFTIFVVGTQLERAYGHRNFLYLYLISGLSASLFAVLFMGIVFSAGPAVMGLLGAYLLVMRRARASLLWVYFFIAVNLALVLLFPQRVFLWQGTVGALLAGLAVGYVYLFEGSNQRARQLRRGLVTAGVVLLFFAIAKAVVLRVSLGA